MIKFANLEFIFAIRGPILARWLLLGKLIKCKIGFVFFTCTPRMTWRGQARGPLHPTSSSRKQKNGTSLPIFTLRKACKRIISLVDDKIWKF